MAMNLRLIALRIPNFGIRSTCSPNLHLQSFSAINSRAQPTRQPCFGGLQIFRGLSSSSPSSSPESDTSNSTNQSEYSFGNNDSKRAFTYMHDNVAHSERMYPKPKRWPLYNTIVHPPEDGPVERYFCHHRDNLKYSPKKMFYIAGFIRGMSIDEAIKQLAYIPKKGATMVSEILEEARELAIQEQNFEYRSKMWIAESFVTKGVVFKGMRKHARMRFGEVRYFHCHYYVKLVEGDPPAKEEYERDAGPVTDGSNAEKRFKEYVEKLRERRIEFAL